MIVMHAKSDPAAGVTHLRQLHEFATRIAAAGFAVYEHHWDVTDSVDWIVVAGQPQQRFEFSWDSHRHVLDISTSTDEPESHVQDWRPISQRAAEDSAAAFEEAEKFLHDHTPKA
jgi:hypothetical protein